MSIFKHLRLLPAVLVLGSGLLAVKGFGLAREARAESAPAALEEQAAVAASAADPALDEDGEDTSAAEVDVLAGLSTRRNELDRRAEDLDMRENLIAAAEKRVESRIAALKALQGQIELLLGKRDAEEQKQIAALVKSYSAMKPKDAARIFNMLDGKVLLDVAQAMKPDMLGAILAAMQPAQAEALTVKLANRFAIPKETAQAAPAQQVASLAPPAQAPATPSAAAPSTDAAQAAPTASDAPTDGKAPASDSKTAATPQPAAKTETNPDAPATPGG